MAFLKRTALWTFVLLFLLCFVSGQGAETISPYQLKAAFLFNFLRFVEWPPKTFATPQAPYVIGILGKDPFGPILDQVFRDKIVDGHPIVIKHIEDAGIVECHIVFVSSSERRRLRQIFDKVGNNPVLTVGETDGFAENGGIINFAQEGNKIRFEVNVDASKRADLKIRSTMLNLAKVVHDR